MPPTTKTTGYLESSMPQAHPSRLSSVWSTFTAWGDLLRTGAVEVVSNAADRLREWVTRHLTALCLRLDTAVVFEVVEPEQAVYQEMVQRMFGAAGEQDTLTPSQQAEEEPAQTSTTPVIPSVRGVPDPDDTAQVPAAFVLSTPTLGTLLVTEPSPIRLQQSAAPVATLQRPLEGIRPFASALDMPLHPDIIDTHTLMQLVYYIAQLIERNIQQTPQHAAMLTDTNWRDFLAEAIAQMALLMPEDVDAALVGMLPQEVMQVTSELKQFLNRHTRPSEQYKAHEAGVEGSEDDGSLPNEQGGS